MAEETTDRDGLMQAALAADETDTPLPADASVESGVESAVGAEQEGETPPEPTQGDESEKKEAPPKSADGGSLKAEDTAKKSKYAAESDRRVKTWQEINAEKERIKAEREQWLKEKADWEKQRAEAHPVSVKDEHGYTAEDYEKAAKNFEEEGEHKLAKSATERAQKLRHQGMVQEFNKKFSETWTGLVKEHPELGNQASEQFKAVQEVMSKNKVLQTFPEGVKYAVEWVKMQSRTKDYDTVKTELEKAKQQLEALNKKLAPTGGRVLESKAEGEVPFEKMNPDQQRSYLNRMAREADGIE